MKKFISLLVALLTFSATSVWADGTTTSKVTSVSTTATPANEIPIGGGYFLVKVATKGTTGYAYYYGNSAITASDAQIFRVNQHNVQTDTIGSGGSLAYVWYVSPSADKSMLCLQNAGNGAYLPLQSDRERYNMKEIKTLANASAFYYSQTYSKGVLLYQTNNKVNGLPLYIHCNNEPDNNGFTMSYWEGANIADENGSPCFFTFYPVTLAEDVTTAATPAVPYGVKQQVDGVDTGVKTESANVALIGSNVTITNSWTLYSNFYDAPEQTRTITLKADEEPTVNFTTNSTTLPFNFGTYYKLKIRNGEKFVMAYDNVANDNTSVPSNDFVTNNIQSAWCFEKAGVGVKMRNANGKYITVTNPSGDDQTTQATLTDAGTTFYLKGKPSNATTSDGFSLQLTSESYLGDHKSNTLGIWRKNNGDASKDGGSSFTIVSTVVADDAKTALRTRLSTLTQPTSLSDNILRVATTEQIAQAQTALQSATTFADIKAAYDLAFNVQPDENAFYRIKGMGGYAAVYPSSEDIPVGTDGTLLSAWNAEHNVNRVIERKKANDKLVPQLWRFVSNGDGAYKIKNANNNCNWANATSNIDMPTNTNGGGNYRFSVLPTNSQTHEGNMFASNDGVSTFQLLLDNHTINAAAAGHDTKLGIYDNHDEDESNYWQFEKVTEIPVTISAAKYTTVGFPFNTRVTTEGVKVFYAKKAENGWVSLTEVENKVIPANQGAILYNETGATTATLAITTDEVSNYEGNVLTATTAKRVGFATLSTYGLGVSKTSGEVCFMKNESTDVPANKAYLLASNYSEAQGGAQELRFAFDGNIVSGIENTLTPVDVKKGVFYDLNGRRVLYPTHGIFINANGQKVFLK